MSLSGILSTSLTGLFVNQQNIQTASNNIANVNTENYARARVVQETNVLQGQTAGVAVGQVQRVVSEFLEVALRTSLSNTAEFSVQREFHDRLQGFLGSPDSSNSLSANLDEIFSSFADVALAPAEALRRTDAVDEIQTYLTQMEVIQNNIQSLRADASTAMEEAIGVINDQLIRIHELNPLITSGLATGTDVSGLQNQMSDALNRLSEKMDVQIVNRDSGAVSIFTTSGFPLVDLGFAQLEYGTPGIVNGATIFPPITASRVDPDTLQPTGVTADLSGTFRTGEMAGFLAVRDGDMVDLSVTLGELSARVQDEFNRIHNQFTAVPPPNTLTGRDTLIDGTSSLNFTGEVTFAVVNSTTTVLGDSVTVDFTNSEIDGVSTPAAFVNYNSLITAINGALTGGTMTLANGVLTFDADAAGDGVVIQDSETDPTSRAGRGFSHFFGLNDLIRSEAQGVFETGLTGAENHNIANGQTINFDVADASGRVLASQTITVAAGNETYDQFITLLNNPTTGLGNFFTFNLNANGELDFTPTSDGLQLRVVSDTTEIGSDGGAGTTGTSAFSFTEAFGIGDQHRINATSELSVQGHIAGDPNQFALAVFDTTVLPSTTATLASGDQRGALAFQALETELVTFAEAGELNDANLTLSQYTARFLANSGQIAARVTDLEADNQALQAEVAERRANISGVNLDEELSNLVIFQNAYAAAARVLSSVQELFDDLLAAV